MGIKISFMLRSGRSLLLAVWSGCTYSSYICCIAEEIQNKIIDRKTELRHHRPPSKAHNKEYENNTHKSFKDGFLGCLLYTSDAADE